MSYGGGEQDQALHLAKAQTRVSVPHQLSSFSHICELGRVGVAQTLLSVLVRLGTPEAMSASAGCRVCPDSRHPSPTDSPPPFPTADSARLRSSAENRGDNPRNRGRAISGRGCAPRRRLRRL